MGLGLTGKSWQGLGGAGVCPLSGECSKRRGPSLKSHRVSFKHCCRATLSKRHPLSEPVSSQLRVTQKSQQSHESAEG